MVILKTTHEPYMQGRTAGPPDPQRLARRGDLGESKTTRRRAARGGGGHPPARWFVQLNVQPSTGSRSQHRRISSPHERIRHPSEAGGGVTHRLEAALGAVVSCVGLAARLWP